MQQFIHDARFAWLCSDKAPNGNPKGHVRRTILAELGRIEAEEERGQIALRLCELKQPTREAVAMVRHFRLGSPPGTPEQLADALRKTATAYLQSHAAMTWAEVREALESLVGDINSLE